MFFFSLLLLMSAPNSDSRSSTSFFEPNSDTQNLDSRFVNKSENPNSSPNPALRTSLPVRFANPENPNSERLILDFSTSKFFVQG